MKKVVLPQVKKEKIKKLGEVLPCLLLKLMDKHAIVNEKNLKIFPEQI